MSEDIIRALEEVESRLPRITFSENNLPDKLPQVPTITLYREKLEAFRLSYQILLESLSLILGKDYKELNVLDLLQYFYQRGHK
jgi:hypothetical protein